MTQERFAEALDISVDFLSLIERGISAPSFETLDSPRIPVITVFFYLRKNEKCWRAGSPGDYSRGVNLRPEIRRSSPESHGGGRSRASAGRFQDAAGRLRSGRSWSRF
jgi:hypothetical protein